MVDKKLRSITRHISRQCREIARSMMQEEYKLYDAIWTDRIRITPALYEHGKDTVREINQLMPNLLTHSPFISTIDEVAERYGFEDTSSLVEYLEAYTPRKPVEERYYEQLLDSMTEESSYEPDEFLTDIPF